MKTTLPQILVIAAFSLVTACNKAPESSGATSEKETHNAPSSATAPDPNLPEKKVDIVANDQMKFDVTSIDAKAGQKVSVTLTNRGTIPKLSMGHNFVLLVPEQDPAAFVESSQTSMGTDYISPAMKEKVLAHTKLLGPGESETCSFAAPRKAGAYTYICSFPGHLAIGMKGTLTVQ